MGKSIICIGRGGLGKSFSEHGITSIGKPDIDVSDLSQLINIFDKYKPKIVINCTGIVGTNKCDNNKILAYLVNLSGVINLLHLCNIHNTKLIHISTMYSGNYNTYTKTKMYADNIIHETYDNSLIVKIPWLIGVNSNNFILDALMGKEVSIYQRENGYLIYDRDLINYILDNIDKTGVISISNEGYTNREEVMRYIKSSFIIKNRDNSMPININRADIVLRGWKEAIKEMSNELRAMQSTSKDTMALR